MSSAEELKKLAENLNSSLHKQADIFGDEKDFEFATYKDLVDYLENLGVNEIARMMNDYLAPRSWFPSGWGAFSYQNAAYPKILAQALVKSSAKESLTDLTNIYYARHTLSPEAMEVFEKDVLANSSEPLDWLTDEQYMPNGFIECAGNETSFIKSVLMLMSNKQLNAHKNAVQARYPRDAAKYFTLMGI